MIFSELIQNKINGFKEETAAASCAAGSSNASNGNAVRSAHQRTLVFFKGIMPETVKQITADEAALYPKQAGYVRDDGCIDVQVLAASKEQLLAAAIMAQGVRFGLYEEFVALAPSLPMIDARVVVVTNNIYTHKKYPSLLPLEDAGKIALYHEDDSGREVNDPRIAAAQTFYADVIRKQEDGFFVSYIDPMAEVCCEFEELFTPCDLPAGTQGAYMRLEVSGVLFDQYLNQLTSDAACPVTLVRASRPSRAEQAAARVLAGALTELDVSFDVMEESSHEWEVDREENADIVTLFHQHWGADKDFRKIKFYENPALSREQVEISQEFLVGQIVAQAEAAKEGESYRNLFITAPTGAGKSLLFQLPALYMARKHKSLTIVVSPLISLMDDQVKHMHDQGIREATCLHSQLAHEEEKARLAGILNGSYSIVYMSPEKLVSSSKAAEIIAQRGIGIAVVDEAHTVTSWGKDFRSDYWFLGDYLRKLKRGGAAFPIVCLTATAVFSGKEDTVTQTLEELGIDNPLVYLGDTRRDNISFDVQVQQKQPGTGSLEEAKIALALDRMANIVSEGRKAIVYCPFTSQAESIFQASANHGGLLPMRNVWCYHGKMDKDRKKQAEKAFRHASSGVLVATKAFGMGVDVRGIVEVYHFAPTGNLADYVQEIGRAGRDAGAQAVASIDFFANDVKYSRMLNHMGQINLWQLKEILNKLYQIYLERGMRRNMLVSPESFSYLFEDNAEAQFKRALLMLKDDLIQKHGFPVLVVRPKATFTKNYVHVADAVAGDFASKYGEYATQIEQPAPIVEPSRSKKYGNVVRKNAGQLFSVDMAKLWEEQFGQLSFADFKRQFFEKDLLGLGDTHISPRKRLIIRYKNDFDATLESYEKCLEAVEKTLSLFRSQNKAFSKQEFARVFVEFAGEAFKDKSVAGSVLDMFVAKNSYHGENTRVHDKTRFVFKRKAAGLEGHQYVITRQTVVQFRGQLLKELAQLGPVEQDEPVFVSYVPADVTSDTRMELRAAELLQMFGLATYEVTGGQDLQMFVRLNDPLKLKECARNTRYKNNVLTDLNERKDRATNIMRAFFLSELTDTQRWDVIEDYFLGNDAAVDAALGLAEG